MFDTWNWGIGIIGIAVSVAAVWPFGLWVLRKLDVYINLPYFLSAPLALIIGATVGFLLLCGAYPMIDYIGNAFDGSSAFSGVLVLLGGLIAYFGFFLAFLSQNRRGA